MKEVKLYCCMFYGQPYGCIIDMNHTYCLLDNKNTMYLDSERCECQYWQEVKLLYNGQTSLIKQE